MDRIALNGRVSADAYEQSPAMLAVLDGRNVVLQAGALADPFLSHVLSDADNGATGCGIGPRSEALANRVGCRPKRPRHRLAHDGDEWATGAIVRENATTT